MKRQQQRII